MQPQDDANLGQIVAEKLREAADSMGRLADPVQWALADLVIWAVAVQAGRASEDDLLGAVDQFLTTVKTRARRCRHVCDD